MTTQVKPIPEGFHSITPSFTFKDSMKAMEFYKKAFGAKVLSVFPALTGKGVMHATIEIGNSIVMMADEGLGPCKSAETLGDAPNTFWIYTENVDAFFKRAVQAGAKETMPVGEQFWGDRMGQLKDPFGYCWAVATKTRNLSNEEVRKGAEAFFANMAKK